MNGIAAEALKYVGAGGAVAIVMSIVFARVFMKGIVVVQELTAVMNEVKGILEERNRARGDG